MNKVRSLYIYIFLTLMILSVAAFFAFKPFSAEAEAAEVTHEHNGITFTPWNNPNELPSDAGSYYLTTNVTPVSASIMYENITLCLNGYTVTYKGTALEGLYLVVESGGVLNIYDCQSNGTVTSNTARTLIVHQEATANIYGGTFENTSTSTSPSPTAIIVEGTATIENATVSGAYAVWINNGGNMTINGGIFECTQPLSVTITGETGTKTTINGGEFINNHGGNVIQNYGTLEMSECTVNGISSDNRGVVGILNSNGGTAAIENVTVTTVGTAADVDTLADKGLRNDGGGTMTVKNCNITSSNRAVWNTGGSAIKISSGSFNGRYGVYNNNGTFELSGSPTFKGSTADIYLSDDQKITVTGTLGNAEPYSVLTETAPTEGSPVKITDSSNTSLNDTTKFTAADSSYAVRKSSGGQLEIAVSNGGDSDNTDPSEGNDAGNITVDSESGENAPAVSIDSDTASRLEEEVYAKLTPEEREAIDNGSSLDIILRVEDAGDTVPVSDQKAAEAVIAGSDHTLGQYLNIDILKFIDGQAAGKITRLNSKISITIEVPENMRNANRAFVIVRIHEGKADTLRDIDNDPNTITILTDRFSTYAIAYQDGGDNTGTGDTEPPAEETTQTVPSYPSGGGASGGAAPGIAPAGSSVPETTNVNAENKAAGSTQKVRVIRDGDNVTAELGEENNGRYANIYVKDIGFVTSALIEKGKARFTLAKDVKFSIVIDSYAYGEDVSADAGIYSDADIAEDTVPVIGIIVPIAVSLTMIFKKKKQG